MRRGRQNIGFDACEDFTSPPAQGVYDTSPHFPQNIRGASGAPKMPHYEGRANGDVLRSEGQMLKNIQGKFVMLFNWKTIFLHRLKRHLYKFLDFL